MIGIIAILATIGAVNFGGARAKARDVKRLADIRQVQSAVEVEAAGSSNGVYPNAAQIQALDSGDLANVTPTTGTTYCYTTVATNVSYIVYSTNIEDDTTAAEGSQDDYLVPAGAIIEQLGDGATGAGSCTAIASTVYCDDTNTVANDSNTYCLIGTTSS